METILGIVGQPSSGKDTVANYLETLGFVHISTANLIREEMKVLNLPLDRAHVSQFVIEKRKERGPGYLAEESIKKLDNINRAVISGFRNVAEIEITRTKFSKNFILLAVQAPLLTRYNWALSRKRDGDQISFEQFKTEEEAERAGSKDSHQVDAVIGMADKVIFNDGTKEELLAKIDDLVKNYEN
jgi:dephospho-CoA kinase